MIWSKLKRVANNIDLSKKPKKKEKPIIISIFA